MVVSILTQRTRLKSAVTPWVPLNGADQSGLFNTYILGSNEYYKWTVKGTENGKYSNFVLAKNFGLKVDDLSTDQTSTDGISIDPNQASFGFHTNDVSKTLSVSIVAGGAKDSSLRYSNPEDYQL